MKTFKAEQLKVILGNHEKWLNGEPDGVRADLSNSDLRGSNLSYSNLSNSDLRGSNLSYSNLSNSDLSYSNLSNSDLSNSDLSNSNLSYSNLSNSDLRGSSSSFAILLQINGMRWPVLLKDDLVKIGCQEHKYEKWKNFSDDEIHKMNSGALKFYNMIIPVLDYHYKNMQWEIK